MFPGLSKYLILIAAVTAFAGGFGLAKTIGDSRINKLKAELATANLDFTDAVIKKERFYRERMEAIGDVILLEQQLASAQATVVTKEVIRYETVPGSGDCVHIPEWLWLHDKAAAPGSVPGDSYAATGPETRGAGTRITDVDSIRVITENYGLCNDLRVELAGWRQYGAELERINEQTKRSSRR